MIRPGKISTTKAGSEPRPDAVEADALPSGQQGDNTRREKKNAVRCISAGVLCMCVAHALHTCVVLAFPVGRRGCLLYVIPVQIKDWMLLPQVALTATEVK